jgi:hypothetical protein
MIKIILLALMFLHEAGEFAKEIKTRHMPKAKGQTYIAKTVVTAAIILWLVVHASPVLYYGNEFIEWAR